MTHTKWQGALFAARGNPTPSFANDPLSQSSTAALSDVLLPYVAAVEFIAAVARPCPYDASKQDTPVLDSDAVEHHCCGEGPIN